jgi:hypothetical protein
MKHYLIIVAWYVLTGLLVCMPHAIRYEQAAREQNRRLRLATLPTPKDQFWLGMFAGVLVSMVWPWVLFNGFRRAIAIKKLKK